MGRMRLRFLGRGSILAVLAERIAQLTMFKAREFTVPQTYIQAVTTDANIPAHHYSFGTFTHTAIKDGDWADPTVWDTGTVPSGNTAIVNTSTYTVTISTSVSFKDLHGSAAGMLRIDPATGTDITITCDSIMCHGRFWCGDVTTPIIESATPGAARVEFIFTQYEDPLTTARLGLMTMGPVRIHGKAKSDRLTADTEFLSGMTSATVTGLASSNWRVGDTIIFPATSYAGTNPTDAQYTGPASFWDGDSTVTGNLGFMLSHDEVRTITAISGDTLTWNTALTYSHERYQRTLPQGQARDIKPVVTNVSRSIVFRSADPSVRNKRGHLMFSFHDDVEATWFASIDMGRTDTDPTLFEVNGLQAWTDNTETVLLTDANNVRGRYPIHLHGNGPFFGRKQAILKGAVVMASASAVPVPGWGITHHNCRAAIEQCVVYKVRGAGIVSELGNEIGQWIGNTVMWARGDGYLAAEFERQELFQNHNGHNGTAYECQARQILQQHNIAASTRTGWMYIQQTTAAFSSTANAIRVPNQFSLRLVDPMAFSQGRFGHPDGFNDYGIEQAQIPDFNDNRCYGVINGLTVSHRQYTDRSDNTPLVSRRFDCFNTTTPVDIRSYSNTYAFFDFIWRGIGSGSLAFLGPVTWHFQFTNGRLEEADTGIQNAGISINYEGFYIDLAFSNVTTPGNSAYLDTTAYGTDYTTHPANGVMEPWVTEGTQPPGGFRVRVREFRVLDSAVDLPQPYPISSFVLTDSTVDPAPGQPRPLFLLDSATSDLSIDYNVIGDKPFITGWIVDEVGIRKLGDHQNPESNLSLVQTSNTGRTHSPYGGSTTGQRLIERNGCYDDGGTWKCPMWFVAYSRLTGDYLTFRVNVTLVNFPSALLTLHTIDPADGEPVLPLLPEEAPLTAMPTVLPAPTIYTEASTAVGLGNKLAYLLTSNEGQAKWTIVGGADQASFEIYQNPTTYLYYLRFVGDANATSGSKVVTVRATAFGATSDLTITTTTVATASDNFDRAPENLEANADWTLASGTAGALQVNASGQVQAFASGTYTFVDLGELRHKVQFTHTGQSQSIFVQMGRIDSANYIRISRSNTRIVVEQYVANVYNERYRSATGVMSDGVIVEASLDGANLELRINGTLHHTITTIATGAVGTNVGLSTSATGAARIDDFSVTALP